jgi:hypothetical protein
MQELAGEDGNQQKLKSSSESCALTSAGPV